MRGCGTARDEVRARARLDRHDWRVTEQAAEFDAFAHAFARYGDDAHGGGFAVDHADGADPPGRIYLGMDSFAAIGRKLQAVADEA